MKNQYIQEFKEKIKPIESFYNHISSLPEESLGLLEGTYLHEARRTIGRIQDAKSFQALERHDIAEEIIKESLEKEIPQVKKLEKLVSLGRLTKDNIYTGETNFITYMQEQQNIFNSYLKSKNINSEIIDESSNFNFNPDVANALISTLYQNAIKWAPKNTTIKQKAKTKKRKTIITMENAFEDKPQTKNIGLGIGIGTAFINDIIQTTKGDIKYYNRSKLDSNPNPIYGIELEIPAKKKLF